jgi:phytoene dehydrogenase-like protein
MSERFDAIVIGGGHNGLIAAAYLARAGQRVVVLERRPVLGGATVGEELFPGFRVATCAETTPRLRPEVVRDLGLVGLGLRLRRVDPLIAAPQLDGTRLVVWQDDEATAAGLAARSAHDAARFPVFARQVRDVAALLAPVLAASPPDVFGGDRVSLLPTIGAAGRARFQGRATVEHLVRWLAMSVADLAEEWFESEALRAVLAASGIASISWGPSAAGTVATLLHQAVGDDAGAFGPPGVVVGGMGALVGALAASATRAGADVRADSPVARVLVDDDMRAAGVVLEDGTEIRAGTVVSNADPRTTCLDLLEPGRLDPSFVHDLHNVKYRGSMSRVHLALAGLPSFPALPDTELLRGRIRLVPSVRFLERAYDDAKYGEPSSEPYLETTLPTLNDPDLAPEGRHLMSVTVRYTPYHLAEGGWDERREALGDAVLARLETYAPGISELVVDRHVVTPLDLEEVYGLPEGNPNHGEHTLDQLLHMRPVPGWERYRTPVAGLYLCGAGTHPGGGVTGMPGHNAARQVLRDRRRR